MKQKIIFSIVSVLFLSVLSVPVIGLAQESDEPAAPTQSLDEQASPAVVPQAYASAGNLRTGTVVQPDPDNPRAVIAATQDKLEAAFGIVTTNEASPIQITLEENQVFVGTTGRHRALVSNENGTIQTGDFLVLSSLSGTLMKSSPKQPLIFAKALASFDGKSNLLGATTLNDENGRPIKQVGISTIPVAIEIIKNPEEVSTKADLPEFLQRIGTAIAEKEVSPVRIYLGTAIVVLSIGIALAVLYVGVKTAIISIGRNPLSKKSIFWGLIQVILTSILVLIIGLFTVYLLLRL